MLELAAGHHRRALPGFQYGARSCSDGVGREWGKQEARRDLTFVGHFAMGFVTYMQILPVWDKHMLGSEFFF